MTGVRHPPPTVVLPGLRERWAPGGWQCASPPLQPPPPPQNAATARQVALAQSVMCRRWAGAFDLNATYRRFAESLTSSPCSVLVAWRPHSGLWRPAGLWRISCPPGLATLGSRPPFCPLGAHDILRTTQRAMANDEAPMANAPLRVNSAAPGCYARTPLTRAR